jgi:nucleotide-binding universal stress UspA family protein
MFNTILVPVDGSQASQKALSKAVELQKYCESDLIILTVFRHQSLLEGSLSMIKVDDAANIIDDVQRSCSKEVAEAAKALAIEMGSKNPRAFVKRGPLARTIVSFAKDHEADLIILGTKGTGGNEQFLLGSVSHKVTGMSDIPVLVI